MKSAISHPRKDQLPFKNYMRMLKHLEFFDSDFTQREAKLCFQMGKMKVKDEVKSECGTVESFEISSEPGDVKTEPFFEGVDVKAGGAGSSSSGQKVYVKRRDRR